MPTPPRNISDLISKNNQQQLQYNLKQQQQQQQTHQDELIKNQQSLQQQHATVTLTERDRVLKTNSLSRNEQYLRLMTGTLKLPLNGTENIREEKRRRKNKISRIITPADMDVFWSHHKTHIPLSSKLSKNESTSSLPDQQQLIKNNSNNPEKSLSPLSSSLLRTKSINVPSSVVKSMKIDTNSRISGNLNSNHNISNSSSNRLLNSISNSEYLNYPNTTVSTSTITAPFLNLNDATSNYKRKNNGNIITNQRNTKQINVLKVLETQTPLPVFNLKRSSRTDRSIHQDGNQNVANHNGNDEKKNRSRKRSPLDRNERSANLSHITGVTRKIQLYIKNRYLQLLPDGSVNGTLDEFSDFSKSHFFKLSYFFFIEV